MRDYAWLFQEGVPRLVFANVLIGLVSEPVCGLQVGSSWGAGLFGHG